jgi:predicted glycoside hydrolase/deacetylase ChbG (UPF0249 family)
MNANRLLLVTADDYGIGPETSRAIRELGALGVLTSTVLLVNSPHAKNDVDLWRRSGRPVEMGWHPCLTMDRPVLPAEQVPSLVDAGGQFHSLRGFLTRLYLGRIRYRDVLTELTAQWHRFVALVGAPPRNINGHKHIHIFPLVRTALMELLARQASVPYVRRLGEPIRTLWGVPGARFKRLCLSMLGRWTAWRQRGHGLPANDWLIGITDPIWVKDPGFFARLLGTVPGTVVELMVHPGYRDEALLGRDCTPEDGQMQRRVDELHLLQQPAFRDACRQARFQLVTAAQVLGRLGGAGFQAA